MSGVTLSSTKVSSMISSRALNASALLSRVTKSTVVSPVNATCGSAASCSHQAFKVAAEQHAMAGLDLLTGMLAAQGKRCTALPHLRCDKDVCDFLQTRQLQLSTIVY